MPWLRPVASGPNALGDLSGQYWNVVQSNLRTQEGDIARANAAQQGWNGYRANVANLERSDEARQYGRNIDADQIARQEFKWGVGRADTALVNAQNLMLAREQIKATADARRSPTDERIAQYEDKRLQQMADGGYLDDVTHILSLAPKIPPELAKQYALRSAEARADIDAQDAQVKSTADILNKFLMLQRKKAEIPVEKFWGGNSERNTAIKEIDAEIAKLQPAYTEANDPKNAIRDLLRADPNTGMFVAATPARPWRRQNSPVPGQSGFAPIMGNVRESEGRWNPVAAARPVTATATAPAPRWTPPSSTVETTPAQSIRNTFATPDDVRAALRSGRIDRDQAIEMLTTAF